MILEVDVGNSALKWRIVNDQADIVARGRSLLSSNNMLVEVAVRFPELQSARLSCVANVDVRNSLSKCIFELWGIQGEFAETKKSFSGLTVVYDDPARLGVDRWLAMLAAFHEVAGPVCVFDCGSAVTVDLVGFNGAHRGGYIVPGLRMQQDVLLAATGQIRIEQDVADTLCAWGASTEQAVNFGVARMVAGFIDGIVDELIVGNESPTAMFLTGGDASVLLPFLKHAELFEIRPELVMNGLAVALP